MPPRVGKVKTRRIGSRVDEASGDRVTRYAVSQDMRHLGHLEVISISLNSYVPGQMKDRWYAVVQRPYGEMTYGPLDRQTALTTVLDNARKP